jgi:hypothetical protein
MPLNNSSTKTFSLLHGIAHHQKGKAMRYWKKAFVLYYVSCACTWRSSTSHNIAHLKKKRKKSVASCKLLTFHWTDEGNVQLFLLNWWDIMLSIFPNELIRFFFRSFLNLIHFANVLLIGVELWTFLFCPLCHWLGWGRARAQWTDTNIWYADTDIEKRWGCKLFGDTSRHPFNCPFLGKNQMGHQSEEI